MRFDTEIKMMNISELKPYEKNAKKHPPSQVERLAKHIEAVGWDQAIVVDENMTIIKGHGRLLAAKKLGIKMVPVITKYGLSDTIKKIARIADNKLTESSWIPEILKVELQELNHLGVELRDIGFDNNEIDSLLDGKINPIPQSEFNDPEGTPEEQEVEEPFVKEGEIWKLGNHRLMCANSLHKDNVEKLLDGAKIDMVFTDPPYGISLKCDYNKEKPYTGYKNNNSYENIANDDKPFDGSILFDYFPNVKEMFIWGANNFIETIPHASQRGWIVWDKSPNENTDRAIGSNFELCISAKKHKYDICRVTWKGVLGHNRTDDGAKKIHPSMKPVALATWFFEKWGKDCNNVADLFSGSGSTLVACEKNGKTCFAMELSPHYCSQIIRRWEAYTGMKAELIGE